MASRFDAEPLPAHLAAVDDAPNGYLNAEQRGAQASNGKPSYDILRAADQIIRGDPGWGGVLGRAVTVTYGFRASAPGVMPDDIAGFSRFNTAQIVQAELALRAWADVANITFVRAGEGTAGEVAYSNNAAILFANYSSGAEGASAFAMYPSSMAVSSRAGDVWVNSTISYNQSPTVGGYGGAVLIHEIGHAIGLAHPSDYDASDDKTLTYAANASYYEDSRQYTVMSYFGEANTGASFGGRYSAAPMLDDIAAAQLEYGANRTTRTGDTVYGFNSNIEGRPWYVTQSAGDRVVFAVWDAGGTDTLDFSGYTANQLIDLRQGNFSNVGGLTGNVAVAIGADIENARGGSGADTLHGNALANLLSGGGGADVLYGYDGADIAQYGGPSSSYRVTPRGDGGWTVQDLRTGSPDGTDTLYGVEGLRFSDGAVALGAPALATPVQAAFLNLTRAAASDPVNAALAQSLAQGLAIGQTSQAQAFNAIIQSAAATTAVASMTYEFFTGVIPTAAGYDYLVAPGGPNATNLNSAYYAGFNFENRYINFAVNLGLNGASGQAFADKYGGVSLFETTRSAYQTIFGGTPSDAKTQALLEGRIDYLASYGGDGPEGLGTKAAMVGWLLAVAVKSDIGAYAKANGAFMVDLIDGAALNVDIVGVYGKPEFSHFPG